MQRQQGTPSQHMLDLRERLNFQRFKYELLVDMVRPISAEDSVHRRVQYAPLALQGGTCALSDTGRFL